MEMHHKYYFVSKFVNNHEYHFIKWIHLCLILCHVISSLNMSRVLSNHKWFDPLIKVFMLADEQTGLPEKSGLHKSTRGTENCWMNRGLMAVIDEVCYLLYMVCDFHDCFLKKWWWPFFLIWISFIEWPSQLGEPGFSKHLSGKTRGKIHMRNSWEEI